MPRAQEINRLRFAGLLTSLAQVTAGSLRKRTTVVLRQFRKPGTATDERQSRAHSAGADHLPRLHGDTRRGTLHAPLLQWRTTRPLVLLIESDVMEAVLVREVLRDRHPEVTMQHARSGAEALQFLNGTGVQPAITLLDLSSDSSVRLAFLNLVKQRDELGHIPVVALVPSERLISSYERYGVQADLYVVKPRDGSEYAQLLQSLVHYWQA